MYFFLSNLSFIDLCFSTTIVPKLLINTIALDKSISFLGCAAQMYFHLALGGTECIILAIMAYDRYVAICNPLRYNTIMDKTNCFKLAIGTWVTNFLNAAGYAISTFQLPFCKSNHVNHYFCEMPPLFRLSFVDTLVNEILVYISGGLVGLCAFLLTLISYIQIVTTILNIKSSKGRHKAFSTCASHLIVISFFYGTIVFMYLRPRHSYSPEKDRPVAILYTAVTPMLNPIIYSIRNKEVKSALRKILAKFRCAQNEISSRIACRAEVIQEKRSQIIRMMEQRAHQVAMEEDLEAALMDQWMEFQWLRQGGEFSKWLEGLVWEEIALDEQYDGASYRIATAIRLQAVVTELQLITNVREPATVQGTDSVSSTGAMVDQGVQPYPVGGDTIAKDKKAVGQKEMDCHIADAKENLHGSSHIHQPLEEKMGFTQEFLRNGPEAELGAERLNTKVHFNTFMDHSNQTSVNRFILLGLSSVSHLKPVYFLLFLVMYITTLTGNVLIIILVRIDFRLQTHMYFFLINLSFIDICFSSTIVPKLLVNTLAKDKSISFVGCAFQMYFHLALGATECIILAVMAYDRYTAICKPLHYNTIMDLKFCTCLAAGSWALSFLNSAFHAFLTFQLPYCKSNHIDHFFCEMPPLFHLSCRDTWFNEVAVYISGGLIALCSFLLTLLSYIHIISTILIIPSTQRRHKAFSTCVSHLTVVSLYYGTIIFMYLRPRSSYFLERDRALSILYTVVTPMVNPIIYSIRNKDVQRTLRRTFSIKCLAIFT
ncbi:uncharacterized protein O3C94_011966 [Discoglossus pictus]